MPRYDYLCGSCQERFELKLSFSAEIEQPCVKCGSEAQRQFVAVPVVFKGSGWYVNDYGKKGSAAGVGPQNDNSDDKTEDSSKSDSKDNKVKDKAQSDSSGNKNQSDDKKVASSKSPSSD